VLVYLLAFTLTYLSVLSLFRSLNSLQRLAMLLRLLSSELEVLPLILPL